MCELGKGASRQAILKYMMQNFNLGQDENAVNMHLKTALKNGLDKGQLVNTTGKGMMGSIKLSKAKSKTKAATAKKPASAVKKPKATTAKAGTSKTATKPKKVSLGASTSKAKKPSLSKATASGGCQKGGKEGSCTKSYKSC